MGENICYKFGVPSSPDLQKLQQMCVELSTTDTNLQKFLLFIAIAFSLFLFIVLFARVVTSNKMIIEAYYKSSFTYFIQTFTVITIIPAAIYLFEGKFDIISQITMLIGLMGMIFVIYEYWPVYKKDPDKTNSIVSTILITLFTLTLYKAYTMGIKNVLFIETSMIAVSMIYLMVLSIFVKLALEVRRKSEEEH